MTEGEKDHDRDWSGHWERTRRRLADLDRTYWHRQAEERNRPRLSPRPIDWNQTIDSFLNPPQLEQIVEPWDRRPGSEHWPPPEDVL